MFFSKQGQELPSFTEIGYLITKADDQSQTFSHSLLQGYFAYSLFKTLCNNFKTEDFHEVSFSIQ